MSDKKDDNKESNKARNRDSWYEDIIGGVAGAAGLGIIQTLIGKFVEKTADKAVDSFDKYVAYKIFGPKSEDERRFTEASTKMPRNWYSRLMDRLNVLKASQSDYYRITVMSDDIEAIYKNLMFHAQLDDDTWAKHVHVMNIKQEQTEQQYQRFIKWVKDNALSLTTWIGTTSQGITDDVHASGIIETIESVSDTLADQNRQRFDRIFGR